MPHENNISADSLPDPFDSINIPEDRNLFASQHIADKLRRNCKNILHINKSLKGYPTRFQTAIANEKESLIKSCAAVEITLIQNIKLLEKKPRNKKKNMAKNMNSRRQPQRVADFRRHVWIRRILPAIARRDEKQHLLIMTTQRWFHRFTMGVAK